MKARLFRATAFVMASVCAATCLPRVLRAQSHQPIYPAYDGFVKNPDGSYTLAFGYFNHNREPVSVPVGPDNSFGPPPTDRQQPTTFLPGQHRFQCFMVVGADVAGTLRWTLAYAGTSTSTSEKMMQYSWELVEGAAQARKIEYTKAPRGVCLNREPVVSILGQARGINRLTVTLPEHAQLFGNVEDEGLPRRGSLTVAWKQISGPGTVTFADPKAARTQASFSAPGIYDIELSASDSLLTNSARVTVTVAAR